MDNPHLIYHFNRFKFEFVRDEVHITDTIFNNKFRLEFLEFVEGFPFRFSLIERNTKDDRPDQISEK